MALEEPESNEGEHDDDVEWHEERFVMMSGKPLGLKIRFVDTMFCRSFSLND